MKHLKSSLKDLRQFFDQAITARKIAEPLVSFDAGHDCDSVRAFMEKRSFDVVGVRVEGTPTGFVRLADLKGETVRENVVPFQPGEMADENTPLSSVIQALAACDAVFVRFLGQVGGIVTRGDLQKAPVRMWLFGLVSMIEMQMLRLIREAFSESQWKGMLTEDRLSMAETMFEDRRKRNEETDLSDCLQWGDKATIILKDEKLRHRLGIKSCRQGRKLFADLQDLRNDLAHSQDIIQGRWPGLANLIQRAEALLERLETTSNE